MHFQDFQDYFNFNFLLHHFIPNFVHFQDFQDYFQDFQDYCHFNLRRFNRYLVNL